MTNEILIGKDFPLKVTEMIHRAKSSIKTVVYDWRWYENDPGNSVQIFNQALVRAVKRGVEIKAIANNDRVVGILNSVGISAKKINVNGIMHAKLMIIDDDIVIIGSHNYTHSAFVVNKEISVALSGLENVDEYDRFFNALWL